MTSYRLSTVTIAPSLAVFAVLRLVTDGRTDRIGPAKAALCTKVHRPSKIHNIGL